MSSHDTSQAVLRSNTHSTMDQGLTISKLIRTSANQATAEQTPTTSKAPIYSVKKTVIAPSDAADSRIANLFTLPHHELIQKYEKLWMAFRINPYPDGKFLERIVQITNIPSDEIKLWCLAKRVLLNVSWDAEQIEINRERPSSCDCTACNILLEEKQWDTGCYASDLQMTDEFLLSCPECPLVCPFCKK